MKINHLPENELFRYIIVGGGAVLIDFLVYLLLTYFNIMEASWAKRVSFITGGVWSFIANKLFTFRKMELRISEPLLFVFVYAIGFAMNTVVHDWVLRLYSLKVAAFLMATSISVIWNYIGQKLIVFRSAV